ncbi:glycosyltransferase [Clostridium botulinum]|uniref:Glycosyltransferase family 4 protein n=1 Tax=Clostridium botulinum TaxID=1491 RepID=A0A6B4JJN4_CLOBO|nr:glycosyltransferase [Clostridium botulinum]EES48619.1 glycosyl transferase, group 1 [Clostridium botulinum E1 str. 'BoNT E Beluga']MBY6760416.1 glycosyltransferase [Clostridium botulinum]MBY6919323.1 glycosyltransferase [Clostridium botulinum]MCR1130201.1 glycosyltransferase [Clostridium botulinum]NFH69137.1 glycosyltransferase family 4 protein [Clostridium botulinum]
MHIMVIPSWYSSPRNQVHGSFFKEQFKALSNSGEKITVAYNEVWPLTLTGKIKEKRKINFSIEDNLRTYRYRDFNYFPKNPLMFKSFNKRMDKLYKEIVKKEGKVDIIHAHSAMWGGISAAYISKKYNIPLVITEHSSLKYAKYLKDNYKKHIFEAYESCDTLIAVGNGLKKELNTYVNKDIEVIHNMVDLALFNMKSDCDKEIRNSKTTFFSCAFLEDGKGMELLIRCFKEAFINEDVVLKIGGEGSLKSSLEELVKSIGMKKQIFFLGALSRQEVANEMKNCDIFALPSEHETFGVVYIEALACGKPVIGAKNGGAEDIITKENGIIIEKNNEGQLISALKYMKENYKNYDENNIRNITIKNYSEDLLVENLKGVYKRVNERSIK